MNIPNKVIFILTGIFTVLVFADSPDYTHEAFSKHMVKVMGKSYLFSDDANTVEYFDFLKENGVEPEGGFQEGKIISAGEAVFLLKQYMATNQKIDNELDSKLDAKFRNKVTILQVEGKVEVLIKGKNNWIPAAINIKLEEGDMIRTAENSSTQLQVGTLGVVGLKENSVLDLRQMKLIVDGENEDIHLHLTKGKLLVNVHGMSKKSSFRTSTPSQVAAVRGTVYELTCDDE